MHDGCLDDVGKEDRLGYEMNVEASFGVVENAIVENKKHAS